MVSDDTTYSGVLKLSPKNSNRISKLVIFINSLLLRRMSPSISYPPKSHQYTENVLFALDSRRRSISSEFCQSFRMPLASIANVLESSCEVYIEA